MAHWECRTERVAAVPGPYPDDEPKDGHGVALVNMGGTGGESWLEWFWDGRLFEYLRTERIRG